MLRAASGFHLTARTRLENGMLITTFVGDEVGNQIYTSGIYEPATVRLMRKLLDSETLFFDVGAHIGQYTLLAAPLAREIHCFEPMPWIYKILQSNITKNNLTNVIPNHSGLMDYTGTADVWEGPKENSGSGSFLRIPGFYEHSYSVKCVTLDRYCEARGLELTPRKLLIKIDVERAELKVLHGAVKIFQYEPTLIIEFNDWSDDLDEIVLFFEQRKYKLQAISDSGLLQNLTVGELFPHRRQSKAVNILAMPPQG
jgi:FkbM family methyltransferase